MKSTHRYVRTAVVLGALVIAAVGTGCESRTSNSTVSSQSTPEPDALKFQSLNVGSVVPGDQTVQPRTMFRPDEKLVATVQTSTAGKSVPIAIRVVAMSNGQAISALSRNVTASGATSTNFELARTDPWPVGRYQVEASVNGTVRARQDIEISHDGPPTASPAQPDKPLAMPTPISAPPKN